MTDRDPPSYEGYQPGTPSGEGGQAPGASSPYGYGVVAPDHPSALTALILGVLGLMFCQLVSPFAWAMGGKALREIDASGGTLGGRQLATVGRILGIVGTAIMGLALLVGVGALVIVVVAAATAT